MYLSYRKAFLSTSYKPLMYLTTAKHIIFFSFLIFIYLFIIYGCVGSSFLCEGFLQLRQVGATLHRGAWASHCRGLSCCRLSNCGSRAQSLRGMWDLPRPGLEPVSPALAGRFSTTVPPGKPSISFFVSGKGCKREFHKLLKRGTKYFCSLLSGSICGNMFYIFWLLPLDT